MKLMNLDNLHKVLMDLANDIRDNYKEELMHHDHVASRKLLDSVKTNVVVGDREYVVTMTLEDYWKYVENDTRPHFPPPNALLKWIEVKPVIPRPGANGRIPTPKQLAYLIGRKISIFGTEGTHDLKVTKDNVIPLYKERIEEALGRDMESYIRKVIAED